MANAPGQGRRPKPTALKLIQGNPGKQKLNPNEPKPPAAKLCPPAPRDFVGTKKYNGKVAARTWRKLAPELHKLGLLTTIDTHQLKAYCETFERQVEIMELLKQTGPLVKSAAQTLKANPLFGMLAITIQQLNRLASEFGLSPAARSRIETKSEDDSEQNEYAGF